MNQMVAHHTLGGCNLQPGDLLGTGTISCEVSSPCHLTYHFACATIVIKLTVIMHCTIAGCRHPVCTVFEVPSRLLLFRLKGALEAC